MAAYGSDFFGSFGLLHRFGQKPNAPPRKQTEFPLRPKIPVACPPVTSVSGYITLFD